MAMSESEVKELKIENKVLGERIQKYLYLGVKYRELHRREYQSDRLNLFSNNMHLIPKFAEYYASQMSGNKLDNFEELKNIGLWGLWESSKKYNPKWEFATRAVSYIKGFMRKHVIFSRFKDSIRPPWNIAQKHIKILRVEEKLRIKLGRDSTPQELAEYYNKSENAMLVHNMLRDYQVEGLRLARKKVFDIEPMTADRRFSLEDRSQSSSLEIASENNRRELLSNFLKSNSAGLDYREQRIIDYLFGLGVHGDYGVSLTLKEAGEIFGITSERTRQLKVRALEKLRNAVKNINKSKPSAELDSILSASVSSPCLSELLGQAST